MLHTAVV